MKNKKPPNKGCTPQELEVILRAKRERKLVSFENGFPKIVESPHPAQTKNISASWQIAIGDEPKAGSILSPASDLLSLFNALEGYLSHYVSELSKTDLRREDCLHIYEPGKIGGVAQLPDELLQKITEKLGQITAERRHIKNRYEIIKFIHNGFMTSDGKTARSFLSKLLRDVAHLEKNQKERIYTPKTDAVADILEVAAQLPPSATPSLRGDLGKAGVNTASGSRHRPQKKRRDTHVNN